MALRPELGLGDELLGEFEQVTYASVARLTRLARDPGNPPYARLYAEDAASRIYQRFVETARKLSYVEDGAGRLNHARVLDEPARRREREIATRIDEAERKAADWRARGHNDLAEQDLLAARKWLEEISKPSGLRAG